MTALILLIILSMVDDGAMIRRHLVDPLREALADTPVVLVNGARQAGKTTPVQSPPLAEQGRSFPVWARTFFWPAVRGGPSMDRAWR